MSDECELCEGTGEIEATTARAEHDTVACPSCVARDVRENAANIAAQMIYTAHDNASGSIDFGNGWRAARIAIARSIRRVQSSMEGK